MKPRDFPSTPSTPHRIVIVGGGAGGLALATRLGDRYGRRGGAKITLVDASMTHLWKPKLHEVAAGTLDAHDDELDYLAQARWHHFEFLLGRMDGLNRAARTLHLAPTVDRRSEVLIPARTISYDTLVIAVGSVTNDLGVKGVSQHCDYLDTRDQADRFQHRFLDQFLRAQTREGPLREGQLSVAIVGAGATGVELAAELRHVSRQLVHYGMDQVDPESDARLVLIEASDRLLPALPARLSAAAESSLRALGVTIYKNTFVDRVTSDGVHTRDGLFIPARMKIWAAGVKAPDWLRDLDGLETNRNSQLVVRTTLQTTRDDNVFALGDCAACPLDGEGHLVPPTAQAAHQQASLLIRSLSARLEGRPMHEFRYRDHGSLVTLSRYTTVGNLMGRVLGSVMVEGWVARMVYLSIHRQHQRAVLGTARACLLLFADMITRSVRPRTMLH
jgi:NADH dehydrogenase